MAFKVNYGLERAERNRLKQAKKEAKALAKKSHPAGEEPPETDVDDAPAGDDAPADDKGEG